jgi:hypothetical protein
VKCCCETVRKSLKKEGFSWKKWRKLLNKANREERESFVKKLAILLKQATHAETLVIYIDEAHIHLETDEGYGWTIKGKRAWVSSSSPGLRKVSFFGAYIYNKGTTRLYPYLAANGDSTVDVLKK